MLQFLIFILSTAALTYGVTRKSPFRPIREYISNKCDMTNKRVWYLLEELVSCQLCFGFWAGLLMYVILYIFDLQIVGYALTGAAASKLFYMITKKLD